MRLSERRGRYCESAAHLGRGRAASSSNLKHAFIREILGMKTQKQEDELAPRQYMQEN